MKMFKRSLVASSIIASLCITSTSYADDIEVKISNSLLDTYTDKYEEADLVVMKLSDIRLSAMAYWAQNESYPSVINDLVADSFYFGTFTTTFGSVINGANNVDSYALTIDLPSPELASYVASSVNGTFIGNTVRLEFGLPMSAIARDVSLSRFDDPANPDLNRMEADIDMNGNNIDNVGVLTANNATINGELVVNSGTNTLEMTASGLSYNGSEVITSDNIGAYSAGADAVLKSEDAIMNGLYTIQGAGSGLNIANESRINIQGEDVSTWVEGNRRGIAIGQGARPLLEIGDGAYGTGLIFNPNYQSSIVDLKAKSFNTTSKLYLAKNAILKAAGQQTWIGADDGRVNANGGASTVTSLVAQDGGYVNIIVGNSTYQNPDYALRATTDSNSNAYVSLMYQSDDKLRTNADGVRVNGRIVANGSSGRYFNLSETAFNYQGNDVLTAGNFMTYAASASDAVSKTQDGTLRGIYTIDGLEEDGVTPSGASLILTNNADLSLRNGSKIIGQDVNIHASRFNKSFVINGGFYSESHLEYGKVFLYGSQVVNLGLKKDTNQDATPTLNLFAQDVVAIRGNNTRSKSTALEANFVDGKGSVELMYDGVTQLKTEQNGLSLKSSLNALYDSDGDNVADTEYFNLSESTFTYKGADVITTANIEAYAATAEDAVSKTQDGTLRGFYTIDGLEADESTVSGAGFDFVNDASLNFGDTSLYTQSSDLKIDGDFRQTAYHSFFDSTMSLKSSGDRFQSTITSPLATTRTSLTRTNFFSEFSDENTLSRFEVGRFDNNLFYRTDTNGDRKLSGIIMDSDSVGLNRSDAAGSANFNLESTVASLQVDNIEFNGNNFKYNGSEVITAANIANYTGGVTDAVSKSQDGTLRGLYTIDGLEEDGVTPSAAGLNFVNSSSIFYNGIPAITLNPATSWNKARSQINVEGLFTVSSPRKQNFFSVSDDGGFVYSPTAEGDTNVDIRSTTNNWGGQTYGQLFLGSNTVLKHNGGNVFIGASNDSFKGYGGGSKTVQVFADDEISLSLSRSPSPSTVNGVRKGIVVGRNDDVSVYAGLNFNGFERLRTTQDGILLSGGLKAIDRTDSSEILSLTSSEFTYNGSDVITAANIATYTGGVTDAVSKSQDGTLRGLYTIDGLEEDGVTPSYAGLNFVNGATITGDISVIDGGTPYFTVNKSGQGKNGAGLRYQPIGPNTDVILSGKSETGTAELILDGYARLRSIDGGNVFIGVADERIESFGGASGKVFVGARNNVSLAVGNASGLEPGLFLEGKNDGNNNAFVSLKYDSETRLNTNLNGIDIAGNFVAAYDSNADGIADTEYLSIDETAFTYNGADVITAANIATYTGGVTDAVSKSQDGTLRGLYTIDGLEDDGVTPSGAGLALNNGASINFQGKSSIETNSAGTSFLIDSPDRVKLTGGNAVELFATRFGDYSRLVVGKSSINLESKEINIGGYRGHDPSSEIVNISSKDQVVIRTGSNSANSEIVFLGKYDIATNENYAQLLYEGASKLTTINEGIRVDGGIKGIVDLDADGIGETEYFNLSYTAFTYNGADVITAANIGAYIDSSDFVSKSQDGTLRGLYTIDGLEEDGVTRSSAGLNLINGAPLVVQNGPSILGVGNGVLQARQAFLRLETEGGLVDLSFDSASFKGNRTFVTGENEVTLGLADSIGVVGENFLTMSSTGAFLNNSEGVFLKTDTAQLSMGPAQTILRANDSMIVSSDNDIALGLGNLDGTSVSIGSDFLRVRPEVFEISHNSLLHISSPDLVVVDPSDEANPVLNVNKTTFTYNGAEVVTADNLNTYIDTTGLVSKSEDGILRGMYTFDGLEEDGVTPSNAGLNFVNGMKIQVNGNDRIFTSNNNRNLNISTIENLEANAAVIRLRASKTGNTSSMSLSDVNFVLKTRDIHLGGFSSQETKADLINLSSGEDIVLRTGPLAGNTEIVFLGKFDASTGESYSQMLYESLPRITTTNNGVEINGAISALFDSDADGIGDTEYLNIERDVNNTLSLTAFSDKFEALTYNSDTKIWATNAELSASEISTTTLSAQFITADDVTVNTRLTVEGIDVGQWIKDCEAGISTGCTM
ncbi:hypothetical protein BM526_18890 (plasmid) [Alteromonas mediterranea]|uniref:beta strand repeat-containing protein n=1 Tax=Alteromonas mediterranea TaxID=314275 RepID=UPI0009033594|nr:hypothetical protein [Alteromonas mediterranea]APE04037.1 hypothetical protein BM526_18890 [Alteromonas mediterranea]